ncbi:hypothetical protein SlGVgp131 [Spodoptera litura granulovirus]|uniref:Uncharacterized protein n=1 Tax=Spodoptera litura granulovirus TaxID=359919 RepID=A5IZY3_9BBAC|nr:hypothetical protein SlGVgp131 [Spodoptera litura granulovirus]ABQ52074.1 hypothetical protein SlGVgp131 [Spodoptera litura granulovirus]
MENLTRFAPNQSFFGRINWKYVIMVLVVLFATLAVSYSSLGEEFIAHNKLLNGKVQRLHE